MASLPKKDYSLEEFETRYTEITRLYDFAEELVSTVESEFVKDQAQQLAVVEPLISEIGDATDVLAEEFIFIAESHKHKISGKASKARIEGSMRRVFAAMNDYQARVRDISKKAHGAIQNIADPIVKKIQRQIEEIVVIFLEFIAISLASIMGKPAMETLKARDPRIVALMMHQQAMSQQQ